MKRGPLFAAVLIVLLFAAAGWLVLRQSSSAQRPVEWLVQGGDGGGLPRATASEENFVPAALDEVVTRAMQDGAMAFLVLRHGHLVAESYASGHDQETRADAGAFAATLVAMSIGVARNEGLMRAAMLQDFEPERLAAALASEADLSYEEYLSTRLWRPLNAGNARFRLQRPGTAIMAGCCLEARIGDWMRVAILLLEDGRFEGEAILPSGWVARMRQPLLTDQRLGLGVTLASAASGAEPFAENDLFYLRGKGRWRLWLAPSLDLAVLHAADRSDAGWDETALPNAVIRAVQDRPVRSHGSALQQLVPGH